MTLGLGLLILFAVLQGSGVALGSTRGEWGIAIAALVVAAAFIVQRLLHGESLRELGLRVETRGLSVALAVSAALIGVAAIYVAAAGAGVSLYPRAGWLALGILAQGGVAEELVFRGYLFGHLRRGRTFWRAALVSMAPFAAVHLILFFTMDWRIALAALLLSIVVSPPLAHLYELGGRTIWAPALVHGVIQGGPKLLVVDDALFPIVWMGLSVAVLWCAFLVRART